MILKAEKILLETNMAVSCSPDSDTLNMKIGSGAVEWVKQFFYLYSNKKSNGY